MYNKSSYGLDCYENVKSKVRYKNPEVMIFMIIELLSSCCYSSILYQDPLPIEALKPYLFDSIRSIMRQQEIIPTAE